MSRHTEHPTTENYQQQLDNYATEMLPPNVVAPTQKTYHKQETEYSNHRQPKQETIDYYQHSSYQQPRYEEYSQQNQQYVYQQQKYAPQAKIGRIQDYDPLSDGPRAPPNTQRASATLIYNSTDGNQRGLLFI